MLEVGSASKAEPAPVAVVAEAEDAHEESRAPGDPEKLAYGFYKCKGCGQNFRPSHRGGDLHKCRACGGDHLEVGTQPKFAPLASDNFGEAQCHTELSKAEGGSASNVEIDTEVEQASTEEDPDGPIEVVYGFYRCDSCEKLYLPSPNGGVLTTCAKCGGAQPAGAGGEYPVGRVLSYVEMLGSQGAMPTREQVQAIEQGVVPFYFLWRWERLGEEGAERHYWRPLEKTDKTRLSSGLWLRYAHPATRRSRIVPIQGKADWLGVLPWLWHLVNWTPAGLWCWGSWFIFDQLLFNLFVDEVFEMRRGAPENPGMYWLIRLGAALVVSAIYFFNASRWHIQYLEKQGYKCTGGVEAQTKGEALAKLASQTRGPSS